MLIQINTDSNIEGNERLSFVYSEEIAHLRRQPMHLR